MVIYGRPKHLGQAGKNIPTSNFFFLMWQSYTLLDYGSQNNQGENHSSHLPALNRRFSRAWYNICTLTHFQSLLGLLISVYDSDPHGTVSDHRFDTISASVHKGQLTPTLPKDSLQFLGHIIAFQEVRGPSRSALHPSNTPLLFLETNRLHLSTAY